MKLHTEIKWILFLLTIMIGSYGMLTGFAYSETFDIQMHDTYFVIENLHVLVIVTFTIAIPYLLTFGIKRMASINRILKTTSTIITGLIGLDFLGLFAIFIGVFTISPVIGKDLSYYDMIILIFGLVMLFLIRSWEIWKIK